MKKALVLITLLLFCFPFLAKTETSSQRIYLIEVFYEKGIISLGEISTKLGYVPPAEKILNEIPCRIRIISFSGEVLKEQMFSLSPYVYYDPPREGNDQALPTGQTELEKTSILAILPYYNNGKWVELSDANGRMLEKKDIGYLARVCGDGVCQDHESFEICSQDCEANGADNYCNFDNFDKDSDCVGEKPTVLVSENKEIKTQSTETEKNNFLQYIFLGVIGVVVIIFLIVMYFFILDKRHKEE